MFIGASSCLAHVPLFLARGSGKIVSQVSNELLYLSLVADMPNYVVALLLGVLYLGAVCLLSEVEVKTKFAEYAIMAGGVAIYHLVANYLDLTGFMRFFELPFIVWSAYKLLDFTLLRSLLVMVICLVGLAVSIWLCSLLLVF